MKTDTISKVATHIIDDYRFTVHFLFDDAGLLKIEERVPYGNWFTGRKWKWKRIYFGHINPIEEAINFFNSHKKPKIIQ